MQLLMLAFGVVGATLDCQAHWLVLGSLPPNHSQIASVNKLASRGFHKFHLMAELFGLHTTLLWCSHAATTMGWGHPCLVCTRATSRRVEPMLQSKCTPQS